MNAAQLALVAGAAVAGGAVNAIAGGGSLITFPALLACGVPPVAASATNTIALCPGYFGAAVALRRELSGQRARIAVLVPAAIVGGIAGALLLLATGDAAFAAIVPVLLLFAAVLLGAQDRLRAAIARRAPKLHGAAVAAVPVALASVYGGYFGAGLGVIIVAVLGILFEDSFTRLTALKQLATLAVNVAAAIVLAIWGPIEWRAVAVMAVGALAGGALGGAVAARVPARALRIVVICVALGAAAYYAAPFLRSL